MYIDIPKYYVWYTTNQNRRWQRRQRGLNKVIARIYNVNIKHGEIYYVRLLLLHVRGATSFENLRTVNGIVYETFLEACRDLNLLSDDTEWFRALREASQREMPRQLRKMFAFILAFADVHNAVELWNEFRQFMIEDYIRHNNDTV